MMGLWEKLRAKHLKHAPRPVTQPAQMHDNVHARSNLPAHSGERKLHAHQHHGLQTREHIHGGVGMSGDDNVVTGKSDDTVMTQNHNPYPEPTQTVRLGTTGKS